MTIFPRELRVLLSTFVLASMSPAADPLHERIDKLLAKGADFATLESARADDAEFLRRVSLDLTGCIPPPDAVRSFFADKSPMKRTTLIRKLLVSPEFARHLQHVLDVMLMERRGDVKVSRAAWQDYLRNSIVANKPYDQLIREILSNDGSNPKTRPAAKFLLERDLDATTVTQDISRIFLGRNIQCAQCHDHPSVDDYRQEEFYSLQAFYNRAFLFPNAQTPTAVIAEKAEGEVSFVSVFDPQKVAKTSPPRMLGRKPVRDPKLEKGKEYKIAPAKDVRPVPAYSRFASLGAELATAENRAFARTAVNRFWALLMGRGLVHPLDYDHPENPASHPELLDLLTDQFIVMKFDLRWLLGEIALTNAYQRSSEPRPGVEALPERFAVALLKPLSPEQLAASTMQATGYTDHVRSSLGKGADEAALDAKLAPSMAPFLATFSTLAGTPQDGFNASLDQTLFLKYGGSISSFLTVKPGNLFDRCAKLKDDDSVVEEVFLSVLTRRPAEEERAMMKRLLKASTDRKATLANIAWSLLASTEFRFNH